MANVLGALFQDIADAIRSKTGNTATLKPNQFPSAIEGITTGGGGGSAEGFVTVTFMNGDVELFKRPVYIGDDCPEPVAQGRFDAPTKESTPQYNYTFYGWGSSDGGAANANILKNITSDKTVYAIFTATARLYTITWLDENGTELPGQKQWAYGTVPSYTPTKDGVVFDRWNPEPVPVTGNASYTAVWSSVLASGTFSGTSVYWTMMTNGTLIISGSGAIPKFKSIDYGSASTGIYYKNSPIYSYASQIKKVVIEDGVTSIGDYTFYKDYTAIKSVEIADSVTTIGGSAFYQCTSLEEAHIPDSVTSIGSSAFYYCSALKQVHIPTGITTLVGFGNSGLTSVTIPANVTEIGETCFFYCTNLVTVTLSEGLTTIASRAFNQCYALAEINIPSTVTTIAGEAFLSCTALKQIEIPSSITSCGSSVFSNSGLESVTLAGGTTTIFTYMFNNAKALTEVNIPNTVTTIESSAFASCSALKEIEFPDSVTTIGGSAFSGCSSLEEVNIPAGVTSIGELAFYNCEALEGIYVDDGNTAYCDIDGVLYNKSVTELVGAPAGFVGSIMIPSTITRIGRRMFYKCAGLTSITIPNSVISIGEYAFYGCNNLTSAIFEDTVGWWVSTSSTATSGDAVDVSDPTTAATLLKSTHYKKYWFNS